MDETKKELRQKHGILIDVFDAVWFAQRAATSEDRTRVAEAYANQVLQPILQEVDPTRLYAEILTDGEEQQVTRYLEAHSLDRVGGRNLTKSIFEALGTYVLRDSEPATALYSANEIVTAICDMFPSGHHARIHEIVPARIQHLASKGVVNHHMKDDRFVLSFKEREKRRAHFVQLGERELAFRASIKRAIEESIDSNEIDYNVNREELVHLTHNCILWYMQEQGKQLHNPIEHLINVLNTEELVLRYLADARQNVLANPIAHRKGRRLFVSCCNEHGLFGQFCRDSCALGFSNERGAQSAGQILQTVSA